MANSEKDFRELLYSNVSAAVSVGLKYELCKMANREKTTVSEIVRRLLEKSVSEYKGVNANGN